MRKSTVFSVYVLLSAALTAAMLIHGDGLERNRAGQLERKRDLVGRLGLTDLCVFTDARYARHPSMADRHTPFQDHPLSFEHFPSGSILGVPPHLRAKATEDETTR